MNKTCQENRNCLTLSAFKGGHFCHQQTDLEISKRLNITRITSQTRRWNFKLLIWKKKKRRRQIMQRVEKKNDPDRRPQADSKVTWKRKTATCSASIGRRLRLKREWRVKEMKQLFARPTNLDRLSKSVTARSIRNSLIRANTNYGSFVILQMYWRGWQCASTLSAGIARNFIDILQILRWSLVTRRTSSQIINILDYFNNELPPSSRDISLRVCEEESEREDRFSNFHRFGDALVNTNEGEWSSQG